MGLSHLIPPETAAKRLREDALKAIEREVFERTADDKEFLGTASREQAEDLRASLSSGAWVDPAMAHVLARYDLSRPRVDAIDAFAAELRAKVEAMPLAQLREVDISQMRWPG